MKHCFRYGIWAVLFIGMGGVVWGQSKTDSLYQKYDYQAFFQLAKVQQPIDYTDPNYTLLNAAVFFETNRVRAQRNRDPLKFSPFLREAALQHSREMVTHQFNGHRNPYDTAWQTPEQRLHKKGWTHPIIGENVAKEFLMDYQPGTNVMLRQEGGETVFYVKKWFGLVTKKVKRHTYRSFARSVVDQWMHSPSHRKNILREDFTHLGCGVFTPSYSTSLSEMPHAKVTQNFGGK